MCAAGEGDIFAANQALSASAKVQKWQLEWSIIEGVPQGRNSNCNRASCQVMTTELSLRTEQSLDVGFDVLTFAAEPHIRVSYKLSRPAMQRHGRRHHVDVFGAPWIAVHQRTDAGPKVLQIEKGLFVFDAELPCHLPGIVGAEPERYVGSGIAEHGGQDVVRNLRKILARERQLKAVLAGFREDRGDVGGDDRTEFVEHQIERLSLVLVMSLRENAALVIAETIRAPNSRQGSSPTLPLLKLTMRMRRSSMIFRMSIVFLGWLMMLRIAG